jgi:hypothetical protein
MFSELRLKGDVVSSDSLDTLWRKQERKSVVSSCYNDVLSKQKKDIDQSKQSRFVRLSFHVALFDENFPLLL